MLPPSDDDYYLLDPSHTDPARVRREREKARKLRKSNWWVALANRGLCHYCGKNFRPAELTMDHVVPIARGGTSTPGNIVAACRACNRGKKLGTPAESLLGALGGEPASGPKGGPMGGEESED
jgi:5-methylcytosine-specific restriction enzyme A